MVKYIYKNKKTGKKIYTDIKQTDKDLILVREIRNMAMKSNSIIKK